MRNAALMREAALKSAIFVGVPRVCRITHITFLLSSVFFFFFPSLVVFHVQTIGALAGLTDALEDDVKAGLRTNSRRCAVSFHLLKILSVTHTSQTNDGSHPPRTANPENIDAIIARGTALWNSIYEPHAVKLHDKLASYHPDLICRFPLLLFLG